MHVWMRQRLHQHLQCVGEEYFQVLDMRRYAPMCATCCQSKQQQIVSVTHKYASPHN